MAKIIALMKVEKAQEIGLSLAYVHLDGGETYCQDCFDAMMAKEGLTVA